MKFLKSPRQSAYALMMTLFFGGISLMALAGALQWCSSTARTTERNNRYFSTVSAAEAATEKVLSNVAWDYQLAGEGQVYNRLDRYRRLTPASDGNPYWNNFVFSDAQGNVDQTYVERVTSWGYVALDSQYEGLFGMAATYRIVSNARTKDLTPSMTAGVRQDIQVAAIPIFQFAIFYGMDLEFNPGPAMVVNGRVHSNGNLYVNPVASLTFQSHVTSASNIFRSKSPLDPTSRTSGTTTFQAEHDSNVRALTLPIGTNNTPAAVRQVVEMPPAGELTNSLMGQQRYYNKADVVIVVSNNTVTATSGSWDAFSRTFTNVVTGITSFVTTNKTFYDKRLAKTVAVTEVDVAKLQAWSTANLATQLGRDVNSIYVADMRTRSASRENAVRLVNGQTLPSAGLTLATPNPAYVQGNYNAPAVHLGTTNTSLTKPASIVADAITVLSTVWKDADSSLPWSTSTGVNVAADTTVNAAFLAGIVPSNGVTYSGGVENFPRFLEYWTNKKLTYNGSMVVLFPSKYATAPWLNNSSIYQPPIRNWAFDLNFMDSRKLPPGTPMIVTTIRAKWAMTAPGSLL